MAANPNRVVAPETRARIIAAIRDWAELVGRPPGAIDWNRASPKHHPPACTLTRRWPAVSGVVATFGSWNRAIAAAGFEPLPQGHRRDPEAWRDANATAQHHRRGLARQRREAVVRMWNEGRTSSEITAALGIARSAVHGAVYRARQDGIHVERRR